MFESSSEAMSSHQHIRYAESVRAPEGVVNDGGKTLKVSVTAIEPIPPDNVSVVAV